MRVHLTQYNLNIIITPVYLFLMMLIYGKFNILAQYKTT